MRTLLRGRLRHDPDMTLVLDLPLNRTLVDVPAADLFTVRRRPTTRTATTLGWIDFSRTT